jgi:hypothetical protein
LPPWAIKDKPSPTRRAGAKSPAKLTSVSKAANAAVPPSPQLAAVWASAMSVWQQAEGDQSLSMTEDARDNGGVSALLSSPDARGSRADAPQRRGAHERGARAALHPGQAQALHRPSLTERKPIEPEEARAALGD